MYEIGTFVLATIFIYDAITHKLENYLLALFFRTLEKKFRGNAESCLKFAWLSLLAASPLLVFAAIQFVMLAFGPSGSPFWKNFFKFFTKIALILPLLCLGRAFLNLAIIRKSDG